MQQNHPPSRTFLINASATTEIYTLSLHDALPIFSQVGPSGARISWTQSQRRSTLSRSRSSGSPNSAIQTGSGSSRSEEHTSELQSQSNLVCRLLLEKKKKKSTITINNHQTMNIEL